ncbi:hypothetical protein [Pseudomonas sp. 2FG]|uniref:hypothetical protein n=1 Tax=Pseudomonas sp. 2FG TaxID=2502191 RepID=UPI0010F4F987|nr:hypothetical protein [Pseudomonas sp. 2FG]
MKRIFNPARQALSVIILSLAGALFQITAVQANQVPVAEPEFILVLTMSRANGETISSHIKHTAKKDTTITTTKKLKDGSEIILAKEISLPKNQVKNILKMKSASNFFERPTEVDRIGFDGAIWKLEIIENGRQHHTERWSPLPPYYSKKLDSKTNKLVPMNPEKALKQSDEVALDMLCILVMMSTPGFDERIY